MSPTWASTFHCQSPEPHQPVLTAEMRPSRRFLAEPPQGDAGVNARFRTGPEPHPDSVGCAPLHPSSTGVAQTWVGSGTAFPSQPSPREGKGWGQHFSHGRKPEQRPPKEPRPTTNAIPVISKIRIYPSRIYLFFRCFFLFCAGLYGKIGYLCRQKGVRGILFWSPAPLGTMRI